MRKKPKRVPLVLNRDEIVKLLQCIPSRKQRMVLTTMYATGLRVQGGLRLSVNDIDSRRMTIWSPAARQHRDWCPCHRNCSRNCGCSGRPIATRVWLFPSRLPDQHLSIGLLEKSCTPKARHRAGLTRASARMRRGTRSPQKQNCWKPVDLFLHSEDPGAHVSLCMTARYTHVRRSTCRRPASRWICCPWSNSRQGPAPTPPRKRRPARSRRNHPPLRSRVPRSPRIPIESAAPQGALAAPGRLSDGQRWGRPHSSLQCV